MNVKSKKSKKRNVLKRSKTKKSTVKRSKTKKTITKRSKKKGGSNVVPYILGGVASLGVGYALSKYLTTDKTKKQTSISTESPPKPPPKHASPLKHVSPPKHASPLKHVSPPKCVLQMIEQDEEYEQEIVSIGEIDIEEDRELIEKHVEQLEQQFGGDDTTQLMYDFEMEDIKKYINNVTDNIFKNNIILQPATKINLDNFLEKNFNSYKKYVKEEEEKEEKNTAKVYALFYLFLRIITVNIKINKKNISIKNIYEAKLKTVKESLADFNYTDYEYNYDYDWLHHYINSDTDTIYNQLKDIETSSTNEHKLKF